MHEEQIDEAISSGNPSMMLAALKECRSSRAMTEQVEEWIKANERPMPDDGPMSHPTDEPWMVISSEKVRALLRQLPADREALATLMLRHGIPTGHGDTHADLLVELEAHLRQLPGVVPDGWKLVPIEPTEEMQVAGANAMRIDTTPICKLFNVPRIYKAMLNTSPASQPGQGKEEAWISVGERTPEKGALVLLAYRSKGKKSSIHMGRWSDAGRFFIHHDNMAKNIERVTHWMPLPASPATDTEERP